MPFFLYAGLVQVDPHNQGVFNSPIPQLTQHVESSRARHGSLLGMCHGERKWCRLSPPETASQSQNSGQISLLLWTRTDKESAISAIRWNKPLNHGCPSEIEWLVSSNCTDCTFLVSLGTYLDVRAGRHGSEEVTLGLATYEVLPSELNFAVFGNLFVTMDDSTRVCPEIRIAQGHYSTTNQWWIAGTKCYHSHQDDGLTCPCANNRNVTNVRFGPAGNDALDVCFETWTPSNSAASLWRPATLMVIVRKMRVTCIFHCWKGACVLWKTRWSATRTTTIIVPIG